MAVSRVLSPFVKRVVIANPLQVKAIAHAHVKADKVDGYEHFVEASIRQGLNEAARRRFQPVRRASPRGAHASK